MGAATSSTQFIRTIGGAIGVSIMGATLSHYLKEQSQILLRDFSAQSQLLGKVLEHPDSVIFSRVGGAVPADILLQVRMHMASGLHKVFIAGLIFSILSLLACLTVPKGSAQSHAWKGETV